MSKLLFSHILLKRVLKTEILTYCTFLKISHFDLDSVHLGDFSSFSFIFIFFVQKYDFGYLHTTLGM